MKKKPVNWEWSCVPDNLSIGLWTSITENAEIVKSVDLYHQDLKSEVKDEHAVLQKGKVWTRKKTIVNTMPKKRVIKLSKKVCRIFHGTGLNAKTYSIFVKQSMLTFKLS